MGGAGGIANDQSDVFTLEKRRLPGHAGNVAANHHDRG
jgi:hypothetical protein